jgi:hypothetical protein
VADTPKAMNDEKKWREEDDARTLAKAELIRRSPERLAGAKRGAARLLKDQDWKDRLSEARELRKLAQYKDIPAARAAAVKDTQED